jgi:hypothetical protein
MPTILSVGDKEVDDKGFETLSKISSQVSRTTPYTMSRRTIK